MLILTRRIQEALKINDDITITVLGVQGGQVRLGIDAPREVEVHREEIYLKIQAEKNGNDDNGTDGPCGNNKHTDNASQIGFNNRAKPATSRKRDTIFNRNKRK